MFELDRSQYLKRSRRHADIDLSSANTGFKAAASGITGNMAIELTVCGDKVVEARPTSAICIAALKS